MTGLCPKWPKQRNPTKTESRLVVVARGLGLGGEWGVTANGSGVSSQHGENALELDGRDGGTVLCTCKAAETLRG